MRTPLPSTLHDMIGMQRFLDARPAELSGVDRLLACSCYNQLLVADKPGHVPWALITCVTAARITQSWQQSCFSSYSNISIEAGRDCCPALKSKGHTENGRGVGSSRALRISFTLLRSVWGPCMKRQLRPSTKSLQPSNQFSTALVPDQDLRLDLMTLVKASRRCPQEDAAACGTAELQAAGGQSLQPWQGSRPACK